MEAGYFVGPDILFTISAVSGAMAGLAPHRSVGEDDPLDALVDGVCLDLAQVAGREVRGDPLDLDEGHQIGEGLADADPKGGDL